MEPLKPCASQDNCARPWLQCACVVGVDACVFLSSASQVPLNVPFSYRSCMNNGGGVVSLCVQEAECLKRSGRVAECARHRT